MKQTLINYGITILNLKTQTLSQSIVERVLRYSNDQLEDLILEVKKILKIQMLKVNNLQKMKYRLMDHKKKYLKIGSKTNLMALLNLLLELEKLL